MGIRRAAADVFETSRSVCQIHWIIASLLSFKEAGNAGFPVADSCGERFCLEDEIGKLRTDTSLFGRSLFGFLKFSLERKVRVVREVLYSSEFFNR